MKFLQKATLAAAIAAAPFSAQALQPIADEELGGVTGQAGVTIEIDIDSQGISVGEVEYTDTGSGALDGGSVVLQNITVKNVTDLKQTIDVNGDGDLVMGVSAVDNMQLAIGGAANKSALALKSSTGEITEVVNDISMQLDLGPQTTYIRNLAGRDTTAKNALGLPVASHDGSVAIQQTMAVRIDDLDVGAFGYTQAQADALDDTIITGVAGSDAGATLKANELITAYNDANGYSSGDANFIDPAVSGTALTSDQETAVNTAIATGSAVGVKDVQFYKAGVGADGVIGTPDDTKEYATISQTIWAKGGSAATGGGLYIQVGQISGTLEVGGVLLANESIGSIKVSDINLTGMTQRIYGHQ